nr:hypothetical protein [Alphaproteobacteria bacterium]
VSPIAQDMERHHETLRLLSSPAVYNAWKNNMMQQLNTMSSSGFYRQITVSDDIVKLGDFYLLEYELKTWTKPNNMSANPDITHGKIYLKIGSYTGDIYDDPESIQQIPEYLNSGADPAPAFNFRISAVNFPQGAK